MTHNDNPAPRPPRAESLARLFHETYERKAPHYKYVTRAESAVPWDEVPEPNRLLMIATCSEVLAALDTFATAETERADKAQARVKYLANVLAELAACAIDMGDSLTIDRKDWEKILSESRLPDEVKEP